MAATPSQENYTPTSGGKALDSTCTYAPIPRVFLSLLTEAAGFPPGRSVHPLPRNVPGERMNVPQRRMSIPRERTNAPEERTNAPQGRMNAPGGRMNAPRPGSKAPGWAMLLPVTEHTIDLDVPPGTALAAVGQTAEDWGAEFVREGEGGKLHLPVIAGMRRGLLTGPVTVEPAGEGSRVVFRPEETIYYVQTQAVVILVLALAGALMTVLWPFNPKLLAVAPFDALLALGGWFLVISRLRNRGPEDFLEAVAAQGKDPAPP